MSAVVQIWRKARGVVIRRGVPADDADDLVQEAFLRLERYERDHEVRSREAFVLQAVANLAVDRGRRAAIKNLYVSQAIGDLQNIASDAVGPEEALAGKIKVQRLEEGLAQLSEPLRRVLLMRRIDGMSFRDIAKREGQSTSAIEKRVARATLMLMKWMDGW